jgi:hypothetical protein
MRLFTIGTAKHIDRFMHYYTQYGLLKIARKQDRKEAERKKHFMNSIHLNLRGMKY